MTSTASAPVPSPPTARAGEDRHTMGTNFYLYEESKKCPTCGHDPVEPLHIGKSSAGWCFSLHVLPDDGICDLADWEARWSKPGARIVDEYDREVSPDDMRRTITERGRDDRDWEEAPWGYHSWQAFHSENHSEPGPRGMIRHRIDRYCIGHGAGTWDLIVGSFS